MFLAADYVTTATNLACMEGANEAARHAVNAILEVSGSEHEPCPTWRFEDGDVLARAVGVLSMAERLPGLRQSIDVATGTANVALALAARATATVKQFWKRSP